MISNTAYESAVAAAFAARLPTAEPLTAQASTSSGDTGDAVVVSSVGDVSAELAVQLLDADVLVDGLPGAPLPDRLRDALESAVSTLGAGALGEVAIADASHIFSHPDAQLFDLRDPSDRTVGRLAVRISGRGSRGGRVTGGAPRLHRIAGVQMELTVEVGRTRMAVRDVLALEPGQVIELDRSAGAPADVRLNGRVIAHGEIVVVDQDYAVRITRILENAEV